MFFTGLISKVDGPIEHHLALLDALDIKVQESEDEFHRQLGRLQDQLNEELQTSVKRDGMARALHAALPKGQTEARALMKDRGKRLHSLFAAYRSELRNTGYDWDGHLSELQTELLRRFPHGDRERIDQTAIQWTDRLFTVDDLRAWLDVGVAAPALASVLRKETITPFDFGRALLMEHTCTCLAPTIGAARAGCQHWLKDAIQKCRENDLLA